jgi:tRNA (guanine-N7-)-methyltransferase
VRRVRRLTLDELAPYLLEPSPTPMPLDWRHIFPKDQPVEIEVGFGKGLFLVTAAAACPNVNFLGIEIARKYQLYTATRLAKRGLDNVRVAKADARLFLRDHVAAGSCQAVHVYFPDPWWKKRHLKRRLFTADFAGECARVLRPGGRLYVVTDVLDYFEVIKHLLGEQPGIRPVSQAQPRHPEHDLDYLTNFERKFRKEGKAIYRASYEKHT